ncbi:MAG TPA: ABC transporter ATP-binding protein [Acetobacteraceae bacterium]|nr:ABC transporter ATP-binding protein [Acetobacteraceae bacterium]
MTGAALQLQDVSGGYGPVRIVAEVSAHIEAGTGLAVLGRNGAGKTTLVNLVAGRLALHGGSVRLGGVELAGLRPSARCRAGIGFVPQERQVFRTLTVQENLDVADLRRGWAAETIYALFPRLAERRRHSAGLLSGGEQQMLAIGRALMGGPRCLLLDEPFEGLAPVVVDGLLEVLLRLRAESGMTMLIVEQRAELALELAERAIVLERGRVALAGSREELRGGWGEVEALLAV